MLVTRTIDRIAAPSLAERTAVLSAPLEAGSFETAFVGIDCLHAIEVVEPASVAPTVATARVVFWNAERLKYFEPSAELVEGACADIVLLCEVDVGMARSGNRHTVVDLATRLGTGYAFGVEFVELGLGDARERGWYARQSNLSGLHGGAILSPHQLLRPALARLETTGRWFDGQFGERRVGGRIALLAEIHLLQARSSRATSTSTGVDIVSQWYPASDLRPAPER